MQSFHLKKKDKIKSKQKKVYTCNWLKLEEIKIIKKKIKTWSWGR